MQENLTRYLVIYTLAYLLTQVITFLLPPLYIEVGIIISPPLHRAIDLLITYLPGLILALFLWHDMSRNGNVDASALLLTLFCSLQGLLIYRSRLPLVRRYAPVVIIYPILQLITIYFLPTYTTLLGYVFNAVILILVLNDLLALRFPTTNTTLWLTILLIITSITTPATAILTIFLLNLPSDSSHACTSVKPIFRYLIPIAILTLTQRIINTLPTHYIPFGLSAYPIVYTISYLILFIIIVVMLYHDAPKTRLSRFWLCASAIGYAPASAMCCLFARLKS